MMCSPAPQDCWKGEGPLEDKRREGRVVTSNSGQLCTRCFSHIAVLIMFQQCKMAPFQTIAAGKRRQIASESKGNKYRRDAFMKILPCLPTSVFSTEASLSESGKSNYCRCSISNSDIQRDTLKMLPNVFHKGLWDGTWCIHFTPRSRNGCLISFSFCFA